MRETSVLVLGDVHAEWSYLASVLLYYQPDICICAGDFGWWPSLFPLPQDALPKEVFEKTRIHFIDGNHENHKSLLEIAPRSDFAAKELAPNLIYQPRGSSMVLPDGRTVFFAGGGKSIDWRYRQKGRTWFPEEILLREHLPAMLPKADIVISHTIPSAFALAKYDDDVFFDSKMDLNPDRSQKTLDEVLEECQPSLWISGHYHRRIDSTYITTEIHVLDMLYSGCCDPEGIPGMFWLSGGAKAKREAGWALPNNIFLPLVQSPAGLYACATMSQLPKSHFDLFEERRRMYRTQKVGDVKGITPGEADSFIKTLCRFHWDEKAAHGDRMKDAR